jgi:hypothetical protein
LASGAAAVAALDREAVIAGLAALDDAVAAVGQSGCAGAVALVLSVGQDAAGPPVLDSAVLVAPVIISSVAVVAQFAEVYFQSAVPAEHLESWVSHHHALVSTDPSLLHLAQTAAAVSTVPVAVITVLALEGFSHSVAAVAHSLETKRRECCLAHTSVPRFDFTCSAAFLLTVITLFSCLNNFVAAHWSCSCVLLTLGGLAELASTGVVTFHDAILGAAISVNLVAIITGLCNFDHTVTAHWVLSVTEGASSLADEAGIDFAAS